MKTPIINPFQSPHLPRIHQYGERDQHIFDIQLNPLTLCKISHQLKWIITPIAIALFPIVFLPTFITTTLYCYFKKTTFQHLLAKTLALPALSLNKEILQTKRKEIQENEIFKRTSDGVSLNGIELNQSESPYWVISFNGNLGSWEHNYSCLLNLREKLNANIVSFNYRGVGASEGFCSSSDDLIKDGEAMIQYLLDKGIKEDRILLWGHSLGGGVGAKLLKNHPNLFALISDRSFESLYLATKTFFWIPIYREILASMIQKWWNLNSYESLKGLRDKITIITTPQDYIVDITASLYHGYLRHKAPLPRTFKLIYPLDERKCLFSRCKDFSYTHVWELPDEIFSSIRTDLTKNLEEL